MYLIHHRRARIAVGPCRVRGLFFSPAFLLGLWTFLLGFSGLGASAGDFRLAPSDWTLLAAGLLAARAFALSPRFADRAARALQGHLFAPWVALMASGCVSAIASPHPWLGFASLAPFAAAGLLIGVCAAFVENDVVSAVETGARWLIAVMAFAAVTPGIFVGSWRALAFDSGLYAYFEKYRFLLDGSTQLAVLSLCAFAILTLGRIAGRRGPWHLDVLLPALLTVLVLLSGSRVSALSGLGLVVAYVGAQACAASRVQTRRAFLVPVAAGLLAMSAALILVRPEGNPAARRAASGPLLVLVRLAPPLRDFIDPEPFHKERLGEALRLRDSVEREAWLSFLDHPLLGTGPGQFRDHFEREVHNTLLGVIVEMGLPGLLALLFLGVRLISPLRRPGPSGRRGLATLVLVSVLLPHGFHFLLRERWMWMFFVAWMWFWELPDSRSSRL